MIEYHYAIHSTLQNSYFSALILLVHDSIGKDRLNILARE